MINTTQDNRAQAKAIEVNGEHIIVLSDGFIVRGHRGTKANLFTKGSPHSCGYLNMCIGGKMVYVHRIIAKAFLEDYTEGKDVDHINGIPSDNSISNLRAVTHAYNCRSFNKRRGSTSKYRGVDYVKKVNKWRARVKVDGKEQWAGLHVTEEQAATAYNKKAVEFGFDEMALNIIQQ